MLRAKPTKSVLLGMSLTLVSAAAAPQVPPMQAVSTQSQASTTFKSSDTLTRSVDREKQLREWEQLKKLQASGALVAGNEELSPISKTVPDTLMDSGLPQVLSLTGVGQQLVAEILHYGRVYRVDNSALQPSNGLWRAVRVTPTGVLLRPSSGWKAHRLYQDRSGNVFVAAPQPGESFPSIAPYAPDPSASRNSFPAAGAEASLGMISGPVTPAQSLATRLPPMR